MCTRHLFSEKWPWLKAKYVLDPDFSLFLYQELTVFWQPQKEFYPNSVCQTPQFSSLSTILLRSHGHSHSNKIIIKIRETYGTADVSF